MSTEFDKVINSLSSINELRDMRVTLAQSKLGAVVCGVGSFVGGVLMGPVGLLAGGTLGGLTAYQMTKGTFQPLSQVLNKGLNKSQQQRLIQDIKNVMGQLDYVNILHFLAACSNRRDALNLLIEVIHNFLMRSGYKIL